MQLWRLACGTSSIVDIRHLKVNFCDLTLLSSFLETPNTVCILISHKHWNNVNNQINSSQIILVPFQNRVSSPCYNVVNQNFTYGNSVAAALRVLVPNEAELSVTLAKVAFEVFPASTMLIVEFCPEIISSLFVCITLPQTCMVSQRHRSPRCTKFCRVGDPQYNTCSVFGNSGLRPFHNRNYTARRAHGSVELLH
jgi:hypothetical protein